MKNNNNKKIIYVQKRKETKKYVKDEKNVIFFCGQKKT